MICINLGLMNFDHFFKSDRVSCPFNMMNFSFWYFPRSYTVAEFNEWTFGYILKVNIYTVLIRINLLLSIINIFECCNSSSRKKVRKWENTFFESNKNWSFTRYRWYLSTMVLSRWHTFRIDKNSALSSRLSKIR